MRFSVTDGSGNVQNSRFWEELSAEHEQILSEHGPETVKRRQALRYFTWQWSWRALRRSEQFRFLLTHSKPTDVLGALAERTERDETQWEGVPWSGPDRWLYTFATRLIWRYAVRATGNHAALQLAEPPTGSPLPVIDSGRLISQDLANTALELAAIGRSDAVSFNRVLEVGAGYGRTAYAIMSLHPDCHYTIVDIEPSLTVSKWYLSHFFPAERMSFIPADEADVVPDASVGLALSISTLSEMMPGTRDDYLSFFDRVAVGGHVYLKQWKTWRNPIDDLLVDFDDYSIPARWKEIFRDRCPVQVQFVEALWNVPT